MTHSAKLPLPGSLNEPALRAQNHHQNMWDPQNDEVVDHPYRIYVNVGTRSLKAQQRVKEEKAPATTNCKAAVSEVMISSWQSSDQVQIAHMNSSCRKLTNSSILQRHPRQHSCDKADDNFNKVDVLARRGS